MNEQEIKEVATAYVLEEYAEVGVRIYVWEEWENPLDDTTAHSCSAYCPPSDYDGEYQWSEVHSCKVTDCKVTKNEEGDIFCTVYADIALLHSCDDEDEIPPEPESREIYCYMEYSEDEHCWYVSNIEE